MQSTPWERPNKSGSKTFPERGNRLFGNFRLAAGILSANIFFSTHAGRCFFLATPHSACGSTPLAAPFYLDCSGTSVCWDSASDSVTPIFEAKNSKRFRPPTLAR